jgi:hypothetical protein
VLESVMWFSSPTDLFRIFSTTGKHSLKKDDYLSMMMQIPPKQRIPITPFDVKTQRDAFTVSLEGLKGVRLPPPLFCIVSITCVIFVDSSIYADSGTPVH